MASSVVVAATTTNADEQPVNAAAAESSPATSPQQQQSIPEEAAVTQQPQHEAAAAVTAPSSSSTPSAMLDIEQIEALASSSSSSSTESTTAGAAAAATRRSVMRGQEVVRGSTESFDGTRIGYWLYGNDEQRPIHVVFIAGLEASHYFFDQTIAALFNDPARRFSVLAIDNRGIGLSATTPPPPGPFTTSMMARDVLAVLTHINWVSSSTKEQSTTETREDGSTRRRRGRGVHVVGLSMGGMIATELALLLVSPPFSSSQSHNKKNSKASEEEEEEWCELKTLALVSTHGGDGSVVHRLPSAKVIGMAVKLVTTAANNPAKQTQLVMEMNFSDTFLSNNTNRSAMLSLYQRRDRLSSSSSPGAVVSMAVSRAQMRAIMSHDCMRRLGVLKRWTATGRVTAVVMVGTADKMILPCHSYPLAEGIGARLVTFEGAGHELNDECLDRFNHQLITLFTSSTTESPPPTTTAPPITPTHMQM